MAVGFCVYIGIKAILIDTMFIEKRGFDEGGVIGSPLLGDKKKILTGQNLSCRGDFVLTANNEIRSIT